MDRGVTATEARLPHSLVRPTLDTSFHIDYAWWDRTDRDLEVYLRGHLCSEHQEMYPEIDPKAKVDHVDPVTAEVTPMDRIDHILISHCSQEPEYVTPQTSLVNAVFRVFLANGNTPLSPEELGARTGRPARVILRTLSGPRVYKGIRPSH